MRRLGCITNRAVNPRADGCSRRGSDERRLARDRFRSGRVHVPGLLLAMTTRERRMTPGVASAPATAPPATAPTAA